MTFIINIVLLALITMVVPLAIIKKVFQKSQVVRKIIILPFFFLGWISQAFLGVLFYGTMSSTLVWICDISVFAMPLISTAIAYKVCGAEKPF